MTEIRAMGIDLAKEVFQVHGADAGGRCVLRKRLTRERLREFMAKMKPCKVFMEACGGSNYWARVFRGLGHEVKLISPQFVKPFVKSNKNDAADAEAILEAGLRPEMRFVPVKESWQQDIQSLHRRRQRLVMNRTALCNEIRGLLGEYGIVLTKGRKGLSKQVHLVLENAENGLSEMMRRMFFKSLEELSELETRILEFDHEIAVIAKSSEDCVRLQKMEGVGPLIATAIVSAVGNGREFKNGRQMAAWLGLVPRQHSSGGKTRLLGISKRGDSYLRGLLIHGARSAVTWKDKLRERRREWVTQSIQRRGVNKTVVALANRNVRVIWALLARKEEYRAA